MNEPDPIESALSNLRPSTNGLDRDTTLYEAGYAAGLAASKTLPAARAWRGVACVAMAACFALAFSTAPKSSQLVPPVIETAPVAAMEWNLDGPLFIRPRSIATAAPTPVSITPATTSAQPTARQMLNDYLSDLVEGDAA